MKKALFTLIALVISATSFAQLIANKTDNKVTFGLDLFSDLQLPLGREHENHRFHRTGHVGAQLFLLYTHLKPLHERQLRIPELPRRGKFQAL